MPHTLVISPAALRAADVVRALRMFQNKESIIGKLFAKHIKLEEAKQFLERARYVSFITDRYLGTEGSWRILTLLQHRYRRRNTNPSIRFDRVW